MASALISGCGKGLGRELARTLARRGYRVFAGVRVGRDGAALSEEAASAGWALDPLTLDVTEPTSIEQAVVEAEQKAGPLDLVINNAGIVVFDAVESSDPAVAARLFATNVLGPLHLIRQVLPGMRAAGTGRIVNVSSINAAVPMPWLGLYSASKHALRALSAALAVEVEPFGVRVIEVRPGLFRSGIGDGNASDDGPSPYGDRVSALVSARRAALAGAVDASVLAERVIEAIEQTNCPPVVVVGDDARALQRKWDGLDDRDRHRFLGRFR